MLLDRSVIAQEFRVILNDASRHIISPHKFAGRKFRDSKLA